MIPVRRRRWFEHFFAWHVRRRFQKRFSFVRVMGLEVLADQSQKHPMLWVFNHTCWWDSLVAFDLSFRTLGLRGHALMDAKNLRALPLLGWIGAFGVDLGDKEDGLRVATYGGDLLAGPQVQVTVFPQGRERPFTERPLGFKPGAAKMALASKVAVSVVPIALRYEHGKHEKPELLVHIGEPILLEPGHLWDVPTLTAELESRVTHLLDEIQRALHAGETKVWPVHIDGLGGHATTRTTPRLAP